MHRAVDPAGENDGSQRPVLRPIAHIQSENGVPRFHDLSEHLRRVGSMAAEFAATFNSASWAHAAGIWHDLGKLQPAFQRYILSANGIDAHIETAPGKVKHAIVGAIQAAGSLGDFPRVTLERLAE